jgi:2Fe-2S ferredoxin
MPKIVFHPLNKIVEVERGREILWAAERNDVPLGSSCSGDGLCGWCKVIVLEGENNIAEPNEIERKVMLRKHYQPYERVACQAKVLGDIVITTTYW